MPTYIVFIQSIYERFSGLAVLAIIIIVTIVYLAYYGLVHNAYLDMASVAWRLGRKTFTLISRSNILGQIWWPQMERPIVVTVVL